MLTTIVLVSVLLSSLYSQTGFELINPEANQMVSERNSIRNTGFNPIFSEINTTNFVIDGNLEEWSNVPHYFINDSFNDSMAGTSEIYSLSISFNDTHVFFGYTGYSSEAMVLFIDTDPGAGTGLVDQFNSASYAYRFVKFTNGFGAEWFLGSWNNNYLSLFNGSANGAWVDHSQINGVALATNKSLGTWEACLPFELLYGTNNVTGKELGVVLLAEGPDYSTAYDVLPNEPIHRIYEKGMKNLGDEYLVTNYLRLLIDTDSDGKPDIVSSATPVSIENVRSNMPVSRVSEDKNLVVKIDVRWDTDNETLNVINNANLSQALQATITITNSANQITFSEKVFVPVFLGEKTADKLTYSLLIPSVLYNSGDKVSLSFEILGLIDSNVYEFTVVGDYKSKLQQINEVLPDGYAVINGGGVEIKVNVTWSSEDGLVVLHDFLHQLNISIVLLYSFDNSDYVEKMFPSPYFVWSWYDCYSFSIAVPSGAKVLRFKLLFRTDTGEYEVNRTAYLLQEEDLLPDGYFLVYNFTDPLGDERGQYPVNDKFNETGLFDLTFFQVSTNNVYVRIRIGIRNFGRNEYGAPYGFSLQMFSIYFSSGHEGVTHSLVNEGVVFPESSPWQYAIILTGWRISLYNYYNVDEPITDVFTGYHVDNYEGVIEFEFLASLFIPTLDWNYYVFVGGYDTATNAFCKYNEVPDLYAFGGGSDSDIDPNVVDTLSLIDANGTVYDEKWFSSYNVEKGRRVSAVPLGPEKPFIPDVSPPTLKIIEPSSHSLKFYEGDEVWIQFKIEVTENTNASFTGIDYVRLVFESEVKWRYDASVCGIQHLNTSFEVFFVIANQGFYLIIDFYVADLMGNTFHLKESIMIRVESKTPTTTRTGTFGNISSSSSSEETGTNTTELTDIVNEGPKLMDFTTFGTIATALFTLAILMKKPKRKQR